METVVMTPKIILALRWALTGFGTLALVGCGGDAVDLGTNGAIEHVQTSDLEGVWTGTVSGSAFVTSPKGIRLEFDGMGAGKLLVGASALPPPIDASVGFPPEAQVDAGEATGLLTHLYEGVAYALDNTNIAGNSLSFELDAISAFEPWCALQTPISTDLGSQCRQNWGAMVDRSGAEKRCLVTNPNTGTQTEEDCLALWLCSIDMIRGCKCDATGCSASDGGLPATVTFELQLDQAASVLEGTFTSSWDVAPSASPVRLTRQ